MLVKDKMPVTESESQKCFSFIFLNSESYNITALHKIQGVAVFRENKEVSFQSRIKKKL